MLALTQLLGIRAFGKKAVSPRGEGKALEWHEVDAGNWKAALTVGRSPSADEVVAALNAMGMVWATDDAIGLRTRNG